jgi:transposase
MIWKEWPISAITSGPPLSVAAAIRNDTFVPFAMSGKLFQPKKTAASLRKETAWPYPSEQRTLFFLRV